MSVLFTLPGDIFLTSEVLNAIRDGYSHPHDFSDPVCSIDFMRPASGTSPGRWVLNWFSKQYAPAEVIFVIENTQIAISPDAQSSLRGKVIDLIQAEIVVLDRDEQ